MTSTRISRFNRWRERWLRCTKCELGLMKKGKQPLVRGFRGKIVLPVDILWIGESADSLDITTGKPMEGPVLPVLDELMDAVSDLTGLNRHLVTNTVICIPPPDPETGKTQKPNDEQVQSCLPHIDELCSIAEPKLAVTLGSFASSIAGMLPHDKPKAIVDIPHPMFMLYQPESEYKLHMAKAVTKIVSAYRKIDN
jgi:uracil-DNA glycosylase family 4